MRQLFFALFLILTSVADANNSVVLRDVPSATQELVESFDPLLEHVLRVNKQIDSLQAKKIIRAANSAAFEFAIDPLLLLALIKVESRFDQDAVGSGGSSKGLVQVIPYWHGDKIANGRKKLNTYSVFDLRLNTWLGAAILEECISKTKNLHQALARYNGSTRSAEYASAVLAEYRKLKTL